MCNLLSVLVHNASIHDTKSGIYAAIKSYLRYPSIKGYCADGGYRKTFVEQVDQILHKRVEISPKIKAEGFRIIPKRWIVERTLAWLNHSRRLSKDYEIKTASEETMMIISHIYTLIKRL